MEVRRKIEKININRILVIFSIALLIAMVGFLFSQYEKCRKDAQTELSVHLNRYQSMTKVFQSDKLKLIYDHFISQYDETVQGYSVFLPNNYSREYKHRLIYFFHGLDGDSMDASLIRELAEKNDYIIVAGNFRGPAWVNQAAISDLIQLFDIIVEKYNISNTILFGISMGGSQALTFGATAPERIKNRLAGIVSFLGATDYLETYRNTSNSRVRKTIEESFGGSPEQKPEEYKTMSAINNLEKYSPGIPFVIIYRSGDKIIPSSQQREMIVGLQKKGYPVYPLELPGDHLFEPVDYQRIFDFIDENPPISH